jgi:biopolymer transport protein ExbB/TolQ
MTVPGTDFLNKIMHGAAQSLLIPDILALLIFLLIALMEFGAFMAEVKRRKVFRANAHGEVFKNLDSVPCRDSKHLQRIIDSCHIPVSQKERLTELLLIDYLSLEDRTLAAKDILYAEELAAKKILAKTDLIAKLGPTLGLLGTIIPLGPGLVALGKGDVQALSKAMTVAFDTTVIGVAAGAIATLISVFRHRWYENELVTLELLLEAIVGGENGENDSIPQIEDKTLVNR